MKAERGGFRMQRQEQLLVGLKNDPYKLRGGFVRSHAEELRNRVRSCEESERREHPLQRIMAVEGRADDLLVTTTDPHLARHIGEALRDAYKGELRVRYSKDERLVRVYWSR